MRPSNISTSRSQPVELRNAVDQSNKEITNRFDFKGSDARVEPGDKILTLYADDEFKLGQVCDILAAKLTKRGVDIRSLERGKIETVGGAKAKQVITVKVGVDQALAKKIVALLKESKLKVQSSIQGEAVRVTGAKRDVLQDAIAEVKKAITDFPLQYGNFRELNLRSGQTLN